MAVASVRGDLEGITLELSLQDVHKAAGLDRSDYCDTLNNYPVEIAKRLERYAANLEKENHSKEVQP